MRIIALFEFEKGEESLPIKKYIYDSMFDIEIEVGKDNDALFSIDENGAHVQNFYGKNIEAFSFIVGKNGSGKTSLLWKLIKFIHKDFEEDKEPKKRTNFAFFVLVENELTLYSNFEIKVRNINLSTCLKKMYTLKVIRVDSTFSENKSKEVHDTETVLLSNSIEKNYRTKSLVSDRFHDMTLMKRLYRQRFEATEAEFSSNQLIFAMTDIKKSADRSVIKNFGVNSSITIESTSRDTYADYFAERNDLFKALDKLANTLIKVPRKDPKTNSEGASEILYQMNKQFLLSQIEAAKEKYDKKYDKKNGNLNENKDLDLINYLIKEVKFEGIEKNRFLDDRLEDYQKFIEKLAMEDASKENSDKVKLPIRIDLFDDLDLEFLKMNIFEALNPRWEGMSSGANCLLSIFGNLSSIEFEANELIIFLDEVDIGLHPEWQRRFLFVFLRSLEDIFPDKKVQVILTTHSPIILSDVRRADVNLIGNVEEDTIKTFGANINDLISESFFLEEGLMGQFSQEKIVSLIGYLTSKNPNDYADLNGDLIESDSKIEALIDEIGEVVLRTQLKKKFLDYLDPKKKIEILEKEIKRLQGEIE